MSRALPTPRAIILVLYWLAFACYSVVAAQHPGYGPRWLPLPDFPWFGLLVIWTLLGLGAFALHVIFGARWSYHRKLLVGLGLYGALAVISFVTWVTDMPGLFYVPGWFVLITFIGLLVLGLAHALFFATERLRNAP